MTFFIELIGFVAGIFGMLTLLPQIYKSIKTKKVEDISLLFLIFFLTAYSLWFIYGILIYSLPLILTQFIGSVTVLIQIYIKFRYKQQIYIVGHFN